MALNCSDTGRTNRAGSAALAVAVPGAHLTEQAWNAISRHHHSATWRLLLCRLGAVGSELRDAPALQRGYLAERINPDPGALTVTVGDTGWLANGRLPSMRLRSEGGLRWPSLAEYQFGTAYQRHQR